MTHATTHRKGLLALIAAVAASVCAPALALDTPFPQVRPWALPQAFIMENTYGRVDSCSGLEQEYVAQGWPRGTTPDVLRTLDRQLKSRVVLRNDQGRDSWTPLTRTVLAGGRKPAADCDDVAVTAAQLAVCAGFPADRLGLMVTQLPSRAREFHLVAFSWDSPSDVWIFGDTMGRPRPIDQLRQKIHYVAYFDDVTEWWALRDPATGNEVTSEVPTSSVPTPDEVAKLIDGFCDG